MRFWAFENEGKKMRGLGFMKFRDFWRSEEVKVSRNFENEEEKERVGDSWDFQRNKEIMASRDFEKIGRIG